MNIIENMPCKFDTETTLFLSEIVRQISELIDEMRELLSRIYSAFESVYNERILEFASHKGIQSPSKLQGPYA
jgi:hypothetical protein